MTFFRQRGSLSEGNLRKYVQLPFLPVHKTHRRFLRDKDFTKRKRKKNVAVCMRHLFMYVSRLRGRLSVERHQLRTLQWVTSCFIINENPLSGWKTHLPLLNCSQWDSCPIKRSRIQGSHIFRVKMPVNAGSGGGEEKKCLFIVSFFSTSCVCFGRVCVFQMKKKKKAQDFFVNELLEK